MTTYGGGGSEAYPEFSRRREVLGVRGAVELGLLAKEEAERYRRVTVGPKYAYDLNQASGLFKREFIGAFDSANPITEKVRAVCNKNTGEDEAESALPF